MTIGGAAATLRAGVTASAVVVGGLAASGHVAAAQSSWAGTLSGAQQVPANASAGSGFTMLSLTGNMLTVDLSWTGLEGGPVTGAHIHCCTLPGGNAAVAVPFVGIASATTGTYNHTFDLTDAAIYTAGYFSASGGTVAGAESRLIGGLNGGEAYVNMHNAKYPGGEIRANVVSTPEPTSFALAALGLGGAGLIARRRRLS